MSTFLGGYIYDNTNQGDFIGNAPCPLALLHQTHFEAGALVLDSVTFDYSRQDKTCVAVDYLSTLGGACFFHNATTYCQQEVKNPDFTHFKRLPCFGKAPQ